MNTFSTAFRNEVVRMARKELKPELQAMRRTIAAHRSEIAALKRAANSLTSALKSVQKQVEASDAPWSDVMHQTANLKTTRQIRFSAQALIDKRAALGLTQKQMAALLGVSSLSVYKWESGHVQPRAAQLQRIAEVLKLGKRKALALINSQ